MTGLTRRRRIFSLTVMAGPDGEGDGDDDC